MFSWLLLRKRVKKLEEEVRFMKEHSAFHLHRQDLSKLYDLVCKHHNCKALKRGWYQVECEDCGLLIALACEHAGDTACQPCVEKFIEEHRKEA